MLDVLLVYPPYTYPRKSPPLGLGYLASVLERAGFSVKIIDMSPLRMELGDLEEEIMLTKPSIIGISFMTNQYRIAVEIASLAKEVKPGTPVIVGGPHASALPHEILQEGPVDFVVIGEGENTMLELVPVLLNGVPEFDHIAGIAYRKDNSIIRTGFREFIQDLDSLPFPAWHLLPVERYCVPSTGGDPNQRVFSLITSRGCPAQCTFCDSHTIFGRRFRDRSAKNIFDEIVYLKDSFGATQFDFADDTITINKQRIYDFCNLILEHDLKITWMCNARVTTVKKDMLELMRRAGCVRMDFGVESGDPKVLKAMKKGISLKAAKLAHKWAHEVGMTTGSFVMVGNVGEDLSSVEKTARLMEDINSDISVSIATPFPGTELYQIAKANGWLQVHDWSRYVTSPTALPGYEPVMVTDKMNQQEILDAFYYLQSRFLKKKLQIRYGKRFYLNPRFYTGDLLRVRSWQQLKQKAGLAKAVLSGLVRKGLAR